jgi:hypothetical protein
MFIPESRVRDLYKMTLILTNERKTKLENIKRNTEQLYCKVMRVGRVTCCCPFIENILQN